MSVRAKFRCMSATTVQTSAEQADLPRAYEFMAMYDAEQPEDQRYAKYTPVGKLSMTVDNPAVSFEPGKQYYLDFTPAD